MPEFYFSGLNRPDLVSLLGEMRAAGMVNAAVACEPKMVEAYAQYPQVKLALDCNAMQRLRRKQRGRLRAPMYQLEEALDLYAEVIAQVGWRFDWISTYDVIGNQALTNWCYEHLLQRLAPLPELARRVRWIYQRGSLEELKERASTLKRVGIGGMVPLLQRGGVPQFLEAVAPIGQALLESDALGHAYGVNDPEALAFLTGQPWFDSADGSSWLIAYRARELLLASGEHISASRLGLRLSARMIAANNIQVVQEWVDPEKTHQFTLFLERMSPPLDERSEVFANHYAPL